MILRRFACFCWLPALCGAVSAQTPGTLLGLRAEMQPRSYHVAVGQPVWVRFVLENLTDEPMTLTVPGTKPAIPSPESGLPLSHIFSGESSAGVSVSTASGHRSDQPSGFRRPSEAPILMIAPFSSVGLAIDLREYFPALRGAGQHRITWQPYGNTVESPSIVVTIAAIKEAEIATDLGKMRIHFFYAETPKHVANFIELANRHFYDGMLFHRLEPGYLIQTGCPRRDGSGIRLDGKRLSAEFSNRPIRKGSVAMALLDDEPNSASCQFFICNTRQKEWNGRYTVFGELVGEESYQTLDLLMASEVDSTGHPTKPIYMRNVRILDEKPGEFP